MAQEKDNLFYTPELSPDRNYRSEAIIPKETIPYIDTPPDDTPPNPIKVLIDDFNELTDIVSFLPPSIAIIKDTIGKLKERIDVMFPDHKLPDETKDELIPSAPEKDIPKINIIADDVIKNTPGSNGVPSLFPKPTNIVISVVKPKTLVQIAQDAYRKDTVDLQQYYLQQLQVVMQKYFQEMLVIMSETGIGDIDQLTKPFDGDAVTISDGNLMHLRDHIVRSQIIREQKARFFKKTHNVDQTMQHMRAWHASEQERERYYAESYGDSESYLDSHSNKLLRDSRSLYNAQYTQAFYDMYKYLNSSVIVVGDILEMSLKEAQAKGKLITSGVDIFKTTEVPVVNNDAMASGGAKDAAVTPGATSTTATADASATTAATGTAATTSSQSSTQSSKETAEKAASNAETTKKQSDNLVAEKTAKSQKSSSDIVDETKAKIKAMEDAAKAEQAKQDAYWAAHPEEKKAAQERQEAMFRRIRQEKVIKEAVNAVKEAERKYMKEHGRIPKTPEELQSAGYDKNYWVSLYNSQ